MSHLELGQIRFEGHLNHKSRIVMIHTVDLYVIVYTVKSEGSQDTCGIHVHVP